MGVEEGKKAPKEKMRPDIGPCGLQHQYSESRAVPYQLIFGLWFVLQSPIKKARRRYGKSLNEHVAMILQPATRNGYYQLSMRMKHLFNVPRKPIEEGMSANIDRMASGRSDRHL